MATFNQRFCHKQFVRAIRNRNLPPVYANEYPHPETGEVQDCDTTVSADYRLSRWEHYPSGPEVSLVYQRLYTYEQYGGGPHLAGKPQDFDVCMPTIFKDVPKPALYNVCRNHHAHNIELNFCRCSSVHTSLLSLQDPCVCLRAMHGR